MTTDQLLSMERTLRIRAADLERRAKELKESADDLRLEAWKQQRRDFQRAFEEVAR